MATHGKSAFVVATLALLFLVSWAIPIRTLQAQPTAQEREIRREVQREWNAEQWRRHNERFFGTGVIIERYPGEAYDQYVLRMHTRCNAQWGACSDSCNLIIDPAIRTSCMAGCNNELYECNAGY